MFTKDAAALRRLTQLFQQNRSIFKEMLEIAERLTAPAAPAAASSVGDADYSVPSGPAVFSEPRAHQIAREILGPNFLGLSIEQQLLGPLSAGDRAALTPLELFNPRTQQRLSERDTLRLLERCRDTHVLGAVRPGLTLVDLHAKAKQRFANSDPPWFVELQQRYWSNQQGQATWMLLPTAIDHGSAGIDIEGQKRLVKESAGLFSPLPVEHCSLALQWQLATGNRLCDGFIVRFPVQAAEGAWVGVHWGGGRLNVDDWYGSAVDGVGSVSARTS